MHQAAIEWTITPENWSGSVEVVTAIDGRVNNGGVARYQQLEGHHLDGLPADVRPRDHRPEDADQAVEHLHRRGGPHPGLPGRQEGRHRPRPLPDGGLHTSRCWTSTSAKGPRPGWRRWSPSTPRSTARSASRSKRRRSVQRYPSFDKAFEGHVKAWDELWRTCDLSLPGQEQVQLVLRFHISHVLQVCSRHTVHHDAGVPARG